MGERTPSYGTEKAEGKMRRSEKIWAIPACAIPDLVLVYKLYRKKGPSEKLLHRFSGPYIVVRQSSSLNYIVKRQGQDKTIEVHVSTLKPFVDRDYDEILSDEETDDQPIDEADPDTQQPESSPIQPEELLNQPETQRTEPE